MACSLLDREQHAFPPFGSETLLLPHPFRPSQNRFRRLAIGVLYTVDMFFMRGSAFFIIVYVVWLVRVTHVVEGFAAVRSATLSSLR